MQNIEIDKILILDFGSQYTQLIARRIREQSVYCEIQPYNFDIKKILEFNPKGIILSGGPSSVYDDGAPICSSEIFNLNLPVLGICYGMQLMSHLLGGKVNRSDKREYGRASVKINTAKGILEGFENGSETDVWMSHGDKVDEIPQGFVQIANTSNTPFAVIANFEKKLYGVQFHPEVNHTARGIEMIKNFIFSVCGASAN